MTAEPMVSFFAEFPCERHCQVEVDLTDAHSRFTRGQMLDRADIAHKVAHRAEPPVRVFAHRGDVTVRAGAL